MRIKTYIALLRGINVGGHKKIKMEELRKLFESLGYESVTTYIQSGNVIFKSNKIADDIAEQLEKEIETAFEFSVTVLVRSSEQFQEIIQNCPYEPETFKEGESLHVSFLTHLPLADKVTQLEDFDSGIDEYKIINNEIYLYLRQSIRHSKLAVQLSKLGVPATVRNWNTVKKLGSLAGEKERI